MPTAAVANGWVQRLVRESPVRWRLPPTGAMRVPGVIFASADLLADAEAALKQVADVATLPGIVDASYAMPDVHWGYGFPIGGVAATDPADGGVVSPGGVGFDISCGVRLLTAPCTPADLAARSGTLLDELDRRIVRGMGRGGVWSLGDPGELDAILTGGAVHAVAAGHGSEHDLERCEDGGAVADASPGDVGDRARERGRHQVGSLGSGNHFVEVQVVDHVHDPDVAARFGLELDQVCVMIHSGSRGLGHQVCQDHVRTMGATMSRYAIHVPDPQLACTPVRSPEGRAYLGAMAAAANFARVNRQLLAEVVRDAFLVAFGTRSLPLVYDVSHNLAKLETHEVAGERRELCVHRKGATRAFPAGAADLPADLRDVGQPVFVPGSMGSHSHVLVGTGGPAFHSAAHGAGRTMSRHAAKRHSSGGRALRDDLAARGIVVRASRLRDLPEEAPQAYKDPDAVVEVCERAGLARRVARLRPLGVVKG
jgi:tRNA-splicing ligase RtcB (3'-phosphate/5'-hydroxy nucleic acid ligase)